MIEANISIVRQRIGTVNNTLGDIGHHLDKYQKVDEFVTLTQDQKTAILAEYETLKALVVTAWNSLIEAETSAEEIIEEE